MFAASDDSFSNNGDLDPNPTVANKKPTKDKAWLPTTTNLTESNFYDAKKAYHVDFNGITWSSKVTAPEGVEFTTPNNNSGNATFTQLKQWSDVQTLEITGTVANTGQALKYKYTGTNGQLGSADQTLPSNITTIKIVLKKGVVPEGRLAGK